ncbi:MAG: hypothetical protein OXF05_08550 [Hyphomicrobiales bacterium]|nr:hypothetical protein [Hyphomicrobiales bacterium]MCY4038585.1 hypothetical protein [Hyphomicrobiales bacterium]
MRTIPATAFVIALAAFVSDAAPVLAGGGIHSCLEDWTSSECIDINNVRDPDNAENGRETADSGDAIPDASKQSNDEPEEAQ